MFLTRWLFVALVLPFLASCSVPPLSSEPQAGGPTVPQITNNINCELASIIAYNPSHNFPEFLRKYGNPRVDPTIIDPRIIERVAADPLPITPPQGQVDPGAKRNLYDLIPLLQDNHFVAAVSLTLDTSDSEGVYPSLSWIHPFNTAATYTRTLGLGGNLNGSQERNIAFSYSIDLANIADGCDRQMGANGIGGLSGSLELADIIADGLTGLEETKLVNVYSSGGPTRPAFDAYLRKMSLGLTSTANPDDSFPKTSDEFLQHLRKCELCTVE